MTDSLSDPQRPKREEVIQLAHGGGGRMMSDLIQNMIEPAFHNPLSDQRHDGAVFTVNRGRLAFTADSFVVNPLFFPGGDIGSLAINGVVNDLAMCGARPDQISVSLILEEGLPMADLKPALASMANAAAAVGAQIVTGDTKVVERGNGDGMFVSASAVGVVMARQSPMPANLQPGDAVILSGDLGRHGIAVMSARAGITFDEPFLSDCAPLWPDVEALIDGAVDLHCLRDLTRGGLAAALVEIAETANVSIEVDGARIPVQPAVQGACELLGLDPLHVANEGRYVAFVPETHMDQALAIMRNRGAAAIIGRVGRLQSGAVLLKSPYGPTRRVHLPSGEQLPRIC